MESLRQMLKRHEGVRTKVYKDILGHKTIGIGHKLKPNENMTEMTKEEIENLFEKDLANAVEDTEKIIKENNLNLNAVQKNALANMVFQMGGGAYKKPGKKGTGVRAFSRTLQLLKKGEYEKASKEALNSRWASQTPKRAKEISKLLSYQDKKNLEVSEENNLLLDLFNNVIPRTEASDQVPNQGQTMEKRPNEEVISKDATVRKKMAQQAESVMPGSGKEIEDKQSWENLKNDEKAGKVLSPMQNFMKGMSHFTPELIAGSLGGWATGPQAAAKMMEPLRKGGEDSLAERRLQLTEGNLALRLEEIKEQRKRTSNLEEDRTLRREKAATQRALNQQNFFIKRKDIAKIIESKDVLNEMDDLIENAKTIAPGVIPFKIAKGIANEVGNLSETEIAKSEISQDWWSKIKRKGNVVLTGELPEGDVENLRKATTLLRKKKNERLKTKADQFIKGSKLYVDPDLVKQSTYDRLGLEVEEKSSAIESAAKKYGLEL